MRALYVIAALSVTIGAAGCFDFSSYDHVTCSPGFHHCDDGCVSNDDIATCGISCTPCPAPIDGNGRAVCDGQQCGIADCTDGYHVCGNACVRNDINACGEACTICPHSLVPHEESVCDGAQCSLACERGFHACGGADAVSCLPDDSFDSCGSACSPCAISLPPNSVGTCIAAQCGYACVQTPIELSIVQQLTATLAPSSIALADFDGDGISDLVSSDLVGAFALVQLNHGDGTFGSTFSLATTPVTLANADIGVGDFDRNGLSDIVISKAGTANVFLNQSSVGQLSFADPVLYSFSGIPSVVDFDGDGHLDIGNGTEVMFGVGDGTFAASTAHFPARAIAKDLNGDSLPDLIYLNGTDLTVQLRAAVGGYESAVDYPVGASGSFVAAGELDGDGDVDLLVTRGNTVTVLAGDGTGAFAAAVDVDLESGGFDAAGDFDGDGKLDLANATATIMNRSSLSSFAFGPRIDYVQAQGQHCVGDVDNDHRDDVAVAVFFDGAISILHGTSKPSLNAPIAESPSGRHVVESDFNGDGRRDVATPTGIYLGLGDGKLDSVRALDQPIASSALLPLDLNGDGKIDLVRINSGGFVDPTPGELVISLGLGDGTMAPSVVTSGGVNPWALGAADLDEDGHLDLLVGSLYAATLSFFHGHGDGTFATPVESPAGTGATSLAIGDYDGDGHLDVAVQGTGNAIDGPLRMAVAKGHGDGSFDEPIVRSFGKGNQQVFWTSTEVARADLNHDGKDDFIAASRDSGVYVFLGSASELLSTPTKYPCTDGAISLTLVDLNGDGELDVVTTSGNAARTSVLAGNGDGTFAIARDYPTRNSYGVAASDVDGDGAPDLVTIGNEGISILLNRNSTRCIAWGLP